MCRRRVLFTGFVARMEDTRLPKCVMFEELFGVAGCIGAQETELMGCGRPQSFRFQRRPVDNYSPGREGMAQDSGTKSGFFSWQNDSLQRTSELDYGMQ